MGQPAVNNKQLKALQEILDTEAVYQSNMLQLTEMVIGPAIVARQRGKKKSSLFGSKYKGYKKVKGSYSDKELARLYEDHQALNAQIAPFKTHMINFENALLSYKQAELNYQNGEIEQQQFNATIEALNQTMLDAMTYYTNEYVPAHKPIAASYDPKSEKSSAFIDEFMENNLHIDPINGNNFLVTPSTSGGLKECTGLDLKGYFIQPIQRIPRHDLLMRELDKNFALSKDANINQSIWGKFRSMFAKAGELMNTFTSKAMDFFNSSREVMNKETIQTANKSIIDAMNEILSSVNKNQSLTTEEQGKYQQLNEKLQKHEDFPELQKLMSNLNNHFEAFMDLKMIESVAGEDIGNKEKQQEKEFEQYIQSELRKNPKLLEEANLFANIMKDEKMNAQLQKKLGKKYEDFANVIKVTIDMHKQATLEHEFKQMPKNLQAELAQQAAQLVQARGDSNRNVAQDAQNVVGGYHTQAQTSPLGKAQVQNTNRSGEQQVPAPKKNRELKKRDVKPMNNGMSPK